jgi:hypothetical protein
MPVMLHRRRIRQKLLLAGDDAKERFHHLSTRAEYQGLHSLEMTSLAFSAQQREVSA